MKIKIEKGQVLRIRFPGMKDNHIRPAVVISTPPEIKVVPLRTSHYHRSDLRTVMINADDTHLGKKASADCKTVHPIDKNEIIGKPLAELNEKIIERIIKKAQ